METDWDEVARLPVPPPVPQGMPTIASSVALDDQQELLWVGNEHVSFPLKHLGMYQLSLLG